MTFSSSADLVATGIPQPMLHHAWPDIWPLIQPAYAKSDLKLDILSELMAQRCVLWAIYAKNVAVAGIVVRLLTHGDKQPPEKHAHLWLVGGQRLSDWTPDFLPKLTAWAKDEGCNAVTGNGRRGWDRIVRKYGGHRVEDRDGQPCWRLDL